MKSKPPSKRTSHESTGQDDDTIRLNRVLANSGICSRREADRHIEMGLVQVNGKIITKMGTKVTFSDEIKFDGQTINKAQKTYLLLNKPKGFVATLRKGKKINKTTQDLIQNTISHETPPVDEMGRTASGLLLLTNDSALQKKLEDNPKIKMVYHIKLAKPLSAMAKDNLIKGIKIQKKIYPIKKISYLEGKAKTEIGIEVFGLNSGMLTKLFSKLELSIIYLDRVRLAGFTKKDLARGQWRYLSKKEISFLKMF